MANPTPEEWKAWRSWIDKRLPESDPYKGLGVSVEQLAVEYARSAIEAEREACAQFVREKLPEFVWLYEAIRARGKECSS